MKHQIPQMEPWIDKSEVNAMTKYLESGGWLTEFTETAKLEQALCNYTKSPYCVMTTNGTVTLILALLAHDIKAGDEVLVPNLTMIATPNAVRFLGATPVFVDVSQKTLCMDMEAAQKKVTKKTKALMYVPLNGRSGDMDEILKFCRKNKLILIEDAAQALGSTWKGKHLGTFGSIGSFSFSVPKIITTGQGGALLTADEHIYKKLKKLKDFGRIKGGIDIHDMLGYNFKFTDLQAVIGVEQMKKLAFRVKRKKEIYKRFKDQLSDIPEIQWIDTNLKDTSPWFIDIYIDDTLGLSIFLQGNGISTRRIYPAITSQMIYREPNAKTNYPVSYEMARKGLWLPSSSKLTDEEIDFIAKTIRQFYRHI
jgi:perosamine synthetase